MSDQAKALELAHLIERLDAANLELPLDEMAPVATELRRLHSVNAELLEALALVLLEKEDELLPATKRKANAAFQRALGQ